MSYFARGIRVRPSNKSISSRMSITKMAFDCRGGRPTVLFCFESTVFGVFHYFLRMPFTGAIEKQTERQSRAGLKYDLFMKSVRTSSLIEN